MATLAIINETTINKCAKQKVVDVQTIIADIQLNIVLTTDWPIWCRPIYLSLIHI